MAVSTSSKFSIAAGAVPSVVGAFDKFEMHATPKYPCGYKVELADGTVLRYAHFGADLNRGVLVSQDLDESSLVETDNAVLAPASCVTTTDCTLGSRYVEMTLASTTVDQYAGGKFLTTDGTGIGYTYDILGNTATNDPATGTIRIELAQPLQVALDATTDVAIQGSMYANLEIATTTDTSIAGVSCSTMDVSEQAWGWIVTKGVVGILADDTTPEDGEIVTLSDGTAGAVQVLAGGGTTVADIVSDPIVGFCLTNSDSAGQAVCKINLE